MTARKRYLILTILFSLLFIALLLTGSYLVHIGSKQFGVAAFFVCLWRGDGAIYQPCAVYPPNLARAAGQAKCQQ